MTSARAMALGTPPLAWFCAASWPVLSPPLTELARIHDRKALKAGWVGRWPAVTEQARLGDVRDGDGVGLIAADDVEMNVVLAHS